jgi:AmmeMemoRadiSam system protein B
MDRALPRLRALEAFPVEVDGRKLVCVHDPLGYAADSIVVAYPTFFLLTLLDGQRSMVDLQQAFAERFGSVLASEELRDLLATLDGHHYLDSPRFAARRAEIAAAFHAASVRPAAHAGRSYPDEPTALRAHLDGFFRGLPALPALGRVAGIVAPHIDLRVGGRAYGHAYAALAASEAERFVILGTAHYPGSTFFAATRKDFATPLGTVATDRELLDRVARRTAGDLYADELLHRTEHAVEFQVVMLQHALGGRRPFTVVPLLVTSFHAMIARGQSPHDDARVAEFLGALREALREDGRRTVVIAAVDFAHVGEKFGDHEGLAPALLAAAEAKDRRLIAALEAGDGEAFFRIVAEDGDRTRVCGLSAMYAFLAVVAGARGRLLHYERTHDDATRSSVSYASLAFA